MKVRLKQNVIVDGKFIERDSVVDDQILPERLRTEAVIGDLEDRSQALVLKEMNFNTSHVDHEGFKVSQPVMLGVGQLISAREIPDSWIEGRDFKYSWTPEERRLLMEKENKIYIKQFEQGNFDVIGNRFSSLRR